MGEQASTAISRANTGYRVQEQVDRRLQDQEDRIKELQKKLEDQEKRLKYQENGLEDQERNL